MTKLFYLPLRTLLIHAGSFANISPAQVNGCPTITVEGTSDLVCPGKPVIFKAKVAGLDSSIKLAYQWTLSVGKIESGQGTDIITVSPEEIVGQSVRATVKLMGINTACESTASQETQVAICCLVRLFDQYGNISFDDEKERLDNFVIQLQHDPTAQGYIVAYGGRITFPWEAQERADRAKSYITGKYNLLDDRIVTMDGGYREDLTVELWVLPPDATPPTPSPTLSPEDVRIIEKPAKGRLTRRRNR
jgi:hypothetical protein